MSRLPLGALRTWQAIYSTGGVRPAARELHVSHSAVSRQLRELEAYLGVSLVDRSGGGRSAFAFTTAGHALGHGVSSALDQLVDTVATVREGHRESSVAVATAPSVAARWLLPRLPDLRRAHPWIEVSIIADHRPRNPADEGADLSIRVGGRPPRDVPSEPLMDESLYPVISPTVWERAARTDDLDALAAATGLVHDRDRDVSWALWCRNHGPPSLDVRRGARLTSADLVLAAAERGLGVALARGRLAAESLSQDRLVRPLGDERIVLENAYWLSGQLGDGAREAVRLCADWLRDAASRPTVP